MLGKRQERGFSLVELMVVVAIIGVLATIAIPRVNRFIAKSRQSEAQVNLSSLYTFNKNFWVEFQGYTGYFNAMGFQPEGSIRYNVGFAAGGTNPDVTYQTLKGSTTAAVPPGMPNGCAAGTFNSLACCPANGVVCATLNGADGAAPPAPQATSVTTGANGQQFVAEAVGRLVISQNCAGGDRWLINDVKNLTNPCDGASR